MSKAFISKIAIYALIAILTIGAGFGVWALIDHFSNKNNTDKLVIYASSYPMYDFAQKIGGDKVEVTNILPPGGDAHSTTISADLVIKMKESDLVVVNGAGMEDWVHDLESELGDKLLVTTEHEGVYFINKTTNEVVPYDPLTMSDEQDEVVVDGEDDGHDHAGIYDPHTWLSLTNAKYQMESIKDALSEIDSQNAEYYTRNYQTYAILLDGLQSQYDALLQDLTYDTFVVGHPAFRYITESYGLTQTNLSSESGTIDITYENIDLAIQAITDNGYQVIFATTNEDASIVQQIARETGIKVDTLNSIATLTQDQLDLGYDYISLMASNLAALVNALK